MEISKSVCVIFPVVPRGIPTAMTPVVCGIVKSVVRLLLKL